MNKQLILLMILFVWLVACGDSTADPAETVEKYLQAKVDGDSNTVRSLLCSEMEAELERETNTFASISGVRLENMACVQGEENRVSCQGKIVALYGEEETEFPLVAYRVVEEDGEWKWCGEAP